MGNENIEEQVGRLPKQPWEPSGVLSIKEDKTPDYGKDRHKNAKGGMLTLEVEEVFHNKGIMEGTQKG